MNRNQREEFWKVRAKKYQNLEWAIKGGYLHEFMDAGEFCPDDYVLDIGTGTGIIAHTISPHVKKVIGVDISSDMLSQAFENRTDNEDFIKMDALKLSYSDNTFTKITARMVFHHILEDTQKAMNECFRVLKPGGRMVFSEGVPPTEHVKNFYTDMFKLKEDRITFMEDDLISMMRRSGFVNINKKLHWMRQVSIKNWLKNSGLHEAVQNKIFQMHLDLDTRGQTDYNMKIAQNDCFIDMKFVILVGEKA